MSAPVKQAESTQTLALEMVDVSTLKVMGAPYNPRKINDHDLEALRRSLRYFGTVEPIVANRRSGHIVGGHQRIKAAQAEGIEALPVSWVDLDDPSEKQLNVALNRIAGEWDDEKLRELLVELDAEGADLELTGFDDAELARLLQITAEGETDPDAVPSDVEQRCEAGDLWQLGRHRLLCGDATSADDVARLLDGAKPLLMVTDPPYGVNYDPAWRGKAAEKGMIRWGATALGPVINDDRGDWTEAWALFPGNVAYVWHAGLRAASVLENLISVGLEPRSQIIWAKAVFAISRGHYHGQHEPCWYLVRKGENAGWIGDRGRSTLWEVAGRRAMGGGRADDANTGHSTQKPVELFTRAISNHQGDVYEPFAGSGTCVVACEQLSRRCFAMEIHPPYCDVTLQRWEQFTGEKAERIRVSDV